MNEGIGKCYGSEFGVYILKFLNSFFIDYLAKGSKVNSTVGSAIGKSHMMNISTKIAYARIAQRVCVWVRFIYDGWSEFGKVERAGLAQSP